MAYFWVIRVFQGKYSAQGPFISRKNKPSKAAQRAFAHRTPGEVHLYKGNENNEQDAIDAFKAREIILKR